MFKNQTPRQLSFFIAALSALFVTLISLVLMATGVVHLAWFELILSLSSIFVVVFLINFYLLRYFIFRRIKLIYKIIHHHKMPSDFKSDKIDMGRNIIGDMEKEVSAWAEAYQQEEEELDRLASYRRRFIGDVSHELKTPIFNIQGFVHTLLDGAIEDPSVNIKFLQKAARNVERLQSIVEDLETINKLEAGQMILDLREFDIYELTAEVFEEMEMRAQKNNVRLIFKEGANQHFQVRADRDSIRQVLVNLIHNSIKYGSEGGVVKVSFYDMETFILVEVSDNGIGIPEQHLKYLFDRFYRVDKSRSRDAGGTGLGLSIVKHIVEAHKQTINVRSTDGQGATFGFTLEKA
jgi:two-component system, OmpR family, phosphate regulon sensor histidine kinase PhoR